MEYSSGGKEMKQHIIFTHEELERMRRGEEVVMKNNCCNIAPPTLIFSVEPTIETLHKSATAALTSYLIPDKEELLKRGVSEVDMLNLKYGRVTHNQIREKYGFPPITDYTPYVLKNSIEEGKTFEKEVKAITDLGYEIRHAECYVANYFDNYICTHEGKAPCTGIDICKEIREKIDEINRPDSEKENI